MYISCDKYHMEENQLNKTDMYENETRDMERYRKEYEQFYRYISRYTKVQGKKILDLCCQWGPHMEFMISAGAEVIGVDIVDYNNHPHPPYKFVRSDAQRLAFKPNVFDIIFCSNAFEHVPDPEKVLLEIHRILKQGGYAYISFIPVYYSDNGSHMAEFIPEPWAHLKYSELEYVSKLKAVTPETDYWVLEFTNGLNRLNREYFYNLFKKYSNRSIISRINKNPKFKILEQDEWNGVTKESHLLHDNFMELQKKYSKEDLLFQGMYLILKKE